MTDSRSWLATARAFAVSLVLGCVLGSLLQSQFNLMALVGLGVDIPPGVWLRTCLEDLYHFGPFYLLVFGGSFLVSQVLAVRLCRSMAEQWQAPVCAMAATLGLWTTVQLVDAVTPPPTLIAATRTLVGSAMLALTAAPAGWLFARWRRRSGAGVGTGGLPLVVVAVAVVAPADFVSAQTGPGAWRAEVLASGLENPWSLALLPDGGMLVTERPGRLRRITADGVLLPEPIAGVPAVMASGQAGLFEVSLAPDFADSRRLYLSYACGQPAANHTCLARGLLQDNRLHQVEEIFRAQPAKQGTAHFGGRIAWLADGTLVLSLGDGFDYRDEAQRLSSHLGTLVRLQADGSVPADNPFVGRPGALPEIYSYGHRNVQGLVFDSGSGRLIAHEHGPRGGDEINVIRAGANYGWPIATRGLDYTGARISPYRDYPGTVPPLLNWTPSIAPSGLALYTGASFPQWQGQLLVGALADRALFRVSLEPRPRVEQRMLGDRDERIRDVRVGGDGLVYLLTDHEDGRVVRLRPE